MMMFKTWGYITMAQGVLMLPSYLRIYVLNSPLALTFTADFKLGHYMKIPPRTMFFAQVRFRFPLILST